MTLMQSNYEFMIKGDSAPNFTLTGTDDKAHSLHEIKGEKATLVIFMCNHCPYVIPKLNEIKRISSDLNVTVIGINSNNHPGYPEDNFENMKRIYEKDGFNFYYLFDETQEVAKSYGATCTPDPFLFDKDLKLVYHGRIDSHHMKETTEPELYNIIKEFLETNQISKKEEPSQGCSIKWKD